MIDQMTPYGFGIRLPIPFDEAVSRTRAELAREGFGVLSEIDVAATLQARLGVDFPPYVILGACNPPLAHRALTAERELGLLLPCNVVVRAGDAEGTSVVSAMDPEAALSLTSNPAVAEVAREVKARLAPVLGRLAAPA